MGWRNRASARRADRALERQLDYMRGLAVEYNANLPRVHSDMRDKSLKIRSKLSKFRTIHDDDRTLEVGSGATGAIFYFGTKVGVGVDPLAADYAKLFPWHNLAETIAVPGERLPFEDASFEVVISDNVIDHAENPAKIIGEISRVLAPGGIFYMTVHIHHPIYHAASTVYGAWNALGLPIEITPFADHTVHLTAPATLKMFAGLPLRIVSQDADIAGAKRRADEIPPRHAGDRLKRYFYKNAVLEIIAVREPS